jgi:hypothetical protein
MSNRAGFISNIPIGFQDEVVLIFLKMDFSDIQMGSKKESLLSGNNYVTDMANPYFLPIFGEYDDFGRIRNIEQTEVVDYISNHFGMDIHEIIKGLSANANRGGNEYTSEKDPKLFGNLTYCLEHRSVYENMIKMKKPLMDEFGISDFMLGKLGMTNLKSNIWLADGIDCEFSTGSSSIMVFKEGVIDEEFHYIHELIKFLVNNGYDKSRMDSDIEIITDIDLKFEDAKKCINMYKSLSEEGRMDYLFSYPGMSHGKKSINSYLDRTSLDGQYTWRFDSEKLPHDIIGVIDDQTVKDFIEFHRVLVDLSISYKASPTCDDDRDYKKHYELLKIKRDVLKSKIENHMEETCDEFPGYDEVLQDMGTWGQNSQLESIPG